MGKNHVEMEEGEINQAKEPEEQIRAEAEKQEITEIANSEEVQKEEKETSKDAANLSKPLADVTETKKPATNSPDHKVPKLKVHSNREAEWILCWM